MMHIRSRRILAAVSAAALLFTSVPSGALAGEPESGEALLVMQEEAAPSAEESATQGGKTLPEESTELQKTDIPGNPEEGAAGEADALVPDGEEPSSDDQEVIEIKDILVNEETEDPATMVVEDGIPEENEEQILPVEEEIVEAAEETLKADEEIVGINVSSTTALVNQDVRIKVFPIQEGKKIEAVRICEDKGFWENGGDITPDNQSWMFDSQGNFNVGHSWWSQGTYTIYAEVKLENEAERYTTKPVEVTVTQDGQVGEFNFSLDTPTVSRGEMAKVTYDKSTHADHYWVDIEKPDGKWCASKADRNGEPGSVSFHTADLEPGEYRIIAKASGIGYEGRNAENSPVMLTITESAIEVGTVSLKVDKTDLNTREDFTFSVYAPGADHIEVAFDYDHTENWKGWIENRRGDFWTESRSYANYGTYKVVARAHYSSGDPVESDPVEISVSAPNGPLYAAFPELPRFLIYDEDNLDFAFKRPVNAEGMEVNVWYDPKEGGGRVSLLGINTNDDSSIGDSIQAVVSTDQLAQAGEGNLIRVEMKAWAAGYEETRREWAIPLLKKADEEIVGINVSSTTALANQDVRIQVFPKQEGKKIAAVRFWDGYGFWENGGEITPDNQSGMFDSQGNFNVGHSWWSQGTYTIYAEVKLENEAERYTTKPVEVTVTQKGQVKEFSFSLDTPTVPRGEMAKGTFTESTNADHYWVDIKKPDGTWCARKADRNGEPGSVSFSTADLEPGEYRITAKASGIGYEGRDADDAPVTLTITESAIGEGTVSLKVDKTDLNTREDFTFSVYAPGADHIEVAFDYDHTENWKNGWIENRTGDCWTESRSYGNSGTYKVVARAHYPSGDLAESDPVTITVKSHKGKLEVSLPDNLPSYLTTEEDFTFEARMPENGKNLSVNVWHDTDDDAARDLFNGWTEGGSLSVTITKKQLKAVGVGGLLRIAVSAEAYDYEGTREECSIPVIEKPDTDRLNIEVDDEEKALVNKDVRITVSPKHAGDKIRAVRFYNGQGFWNESRPERQREQFDSNGNFSISENWWEKGIKRVYAQVTFDEWNDNADGDDGGRTWYTTDVVEVNVTKIGETGEFSCSLDGESVARGGLVKVTFTKSDNADHYWVDIEKPDGTWCGHKADRIGEPGSASFGTADLEPGEYRIIGKTSGIGYKGCDAKEICYLTVTENGIPKGKVSLSVSNTELDTLENFAVSVFAPGAQRVEVFYDYQGEGSWWNWSSSREGESLEEQSNYGHSGVYSLAAKAYYYKTDDNGNPISEEVIKISEPINLTVKAPNGALSVKLPEGLPARLSAGDTLTFTVQKPEQADFVQVRVSYDPDDPDANRDLFMDWIRENSRVITVPADKLAVVKEGKCVQVRVYANAAGYEDANASAQIPIVPANTEKLTMTVEKTSAKVNERIKIKVSPKDGGDSIQAVRLWTGRRYFSGEDEITRDDIDGKDWFDEDGSFAASPRYDVAGTYPVFALVTFDKRNNRGEDTRTWYTTETVEINVERQDGDVVSPVFTLDKTRVKPDGTVKGTVESVDHAVEYWLQCEKWYEVDDNHKEAGWYFETERKLNAEELGSFELPMEALSPGDYHVYIYVLGEIGYRGCDANDGKPVELKVRNPWIEEEEEAALEELRSIIDSLPFTAGAADEASVARAQEILDNLNDVQKQYLGGEDVVKEFIEKVKAAKAQVDKAKADAVIEQINALPAGAGLAQKDVIEAAAAAYEALTDAQKALVGADTKKKLTDAQDKVAAETVAQQLNALNANAGLADQAAVEAARKAYNSLTDAQKALVSTDALNKLTSAEASVQNAKAAAEAAAEAAKIVPQEQITISKAPAGVKAKAEKKGKVTLTWKKFKQTKKTKAIWKKVKQVEVQYSTDKTFTTGVFSKKLGKKKTKLVVKKLIPKTTYYFRVRYIEGPLMVSKWSAVKKVKAKK